MLREFVASSAFDAYAPVIAPEAFAGIIAVATAACGVLVVIAINSIIESYECDRMLRRAGEVRVFTQDEGAER